MKVTSAAGVLPLLSLFGKLVSAIPAELLAERAVCNADLCLRFAKTPQKTSAASSFCSEAVATPTTTVTSTTIATAFSDPPAAITTTITTDGTETVQQGIVCTYTIPPPITYYVKRDATPTPAATPYSDQIYSACTSANGVPAASRVTSACQCLLGSTTHAPPATVTSTVTTTQTTTIPSGPQPENVTVYKAATTQTTTTCTTTVSTQIYNYATVTGTCQNLPNPFAVNGMGPAGFYVRRFVKQCNYQYNSYWYTLGIAGNVQDLVQCLQFCASSGTANCIAVNWIAGGDSKGNNCYGLKSYTSISGSNGAYSSTGDAFYIQ